MTTKPTYFVQPFQRRGEDLHAGELISCRDEDHAGRRGRAMLGRVAGMVFYKIDTSADGDVWHEVEVLATVGDLPEEAA